MPVVLTKAIALLMVLQIATPAVASGVASKSLARTVLQHITDSQVPYFPLCPPTMLAQMDVDMDAADLLHAYTSQ